MIFKYLKLYIRHIPVIASQLFAPIMLSCRDVPPGADLCGANEQEVHHGRDYRTHGTQRFVVRHGYCHCRIDFDDRLKIMRLLLAPRSILPRVA